MMGVRAKTLKQAFTIIEMIVVIAIIAILIGIAIPNFLGIRNEARQVRAEADLRVMKLALDDYHISHASFPVDDVTQGQAALVLQKSAPLESYCYDPFGPNPTTLYEYKLSSNGLYFVVYSLGVGGAAAMTVANDGSIATTAGKPIYVTNGEVK